MAGSTDVAFDVIARDRASDTFRDVGNKADGLGTKLADFGKTGAMAMAGFAAAGAAAVTALAAAGAQFALEKSKSDALLAGQLGVGPQQAKELGKVTGALFVEGWAESTAEAADAVRATVQNNLVDPNMGAEAIEAMSTRTAAAARLMQEDFTRVSAAVSNMIRTGMVRDAEQAFDLLVAATQRGLNKNQDLLDTLNEYSTQFRQLGIDGPMALGLISQAMQAGARDSDHIADALKEFAIRAIDGSKLSAEGFAALGLSAQKMTAQMALGGDAAAEGLATVIERLRAMKDPVAQNAAAVALFGTKAEDLGQALFALDPQAAFKEFSRAFSDTEGSMDRFIESQESAGQRLDKLWKGAANSLAEKLLPFIEKVIDKIEEWTSDPEIKQWFSDLEEDIRGAVDTLMPMLEGAFSFMTDSFGDNKETIKVGIIGLIVAVASLGAAFMALVGIVAHVTGFIHESFKFAVRTALFFIGNFVEASAKAFGWIPGIGEDLKKAAADFARFRDRVNAALDGIKNKTIKVNITGSGARFVTDDGTGIPFGGGFQARAHGGPAMAGRPYIVGDGGRPELFVPTENGVILPSVPKGIAGGMGTQVIELRAVGFHGGLERLFLSWLQEAVRQNPGVTLRTG